MLLREGGWGVRFCPEVLVLGQVRAIYRANLSANMPLRNSLLCLIRSWDSSRGPSTDVDGVGEEPGPPLAVELQPRLQPVHSGFGEGVLERGLPLGHRDFLAVPNESQVRRKR